MAKLFGYPINVEAEKEEEGGSSINARSDTQPNGEAMSLPIHRETNRFLESGSNPMDSESDLHHCFIDFFGRESREVRGRNQIVRGVDVWGGFDDVEVELGLGIGTGSGEIQVKETDSGRVEVVTDLNPLEIDLFGVGGCTDLTPFEDDLFCEEEELEWESLQNDVTWESEPLQGSLLEEEEEEDDDTEDEEEEGEEELDLTSIDNTNNDEAFYEDSLEEVLANAFEGIVPMDLDDQDFLREFGDDTDGDFDDFWAHMLNQEPPTPTIMGARPASKRFVDDLPSVEITSEEFSNGKVVCAICIGDFVVEEKVTRLPCKHYYHGECVVPWLGMKNTCPVCRFELPTDDVEYERSRRSHRQGV